MMLYKCEVCAFVGTSEPEAQGHISHNPGHHYHTIHQVGDEDDLLSEAGVMAHRSAGTMITKWCRDATAVVAKIRSQLKREHRHVDNELWGFVQVLVSKAPLLPSTYNPLADHVRKTLWEVCTRARPVKFSWKQPAHVQEFIEAVQTLIEDLELGPKAPACMAAMRAAPAPQT